MTRELLTHLSEEALDDVLIGIGSGESEAHLARCAECRAKVEEFRLDVVLFNTASMAWSEEQPWRAPNQTRRVPVRRMPLALVGSTVVASLAIAVALSLGHHRSQLPGDKGSNDVVQIQDTQVQIAQDNELMQAVNAAIGPQDELNVDEYGISESQRKRVKAHPK